MKFGKRMGRALQYLGEAYEIKMIDREDCLYRDLGNGFDIEISGVASSNEKRKVCNFICVWDVRRGKGLASRSTEYIREPATLEILKSILDDLVQIYSGENPPTEDRDCYAHEWDPNKFRKG